MSIQSYLPTYYLLLTTYYYTYYLLTYIFFSTKTSPSPSLTLSLSVDSAMEINDINDESSDKDRDSRWQLDPRWVMSHVMSDQTCNADAGAPFDGAFIWFYFIFRFRWSSRIQLKKIGCLKMVWASHSLPPPHVVSTDMTSQMVAWCMCILAGNKFGWQQLNEMSNSNQSWSSFNFHWPEQDSTKLNDINQESRVKSRV